MRISYFDSQSKEIIYLFILMFEPDTKSIEHKLTCKLGDYFFDVYCVKKNITLTSDPQSVFVLILDQN